MRARRNRHSLLATWAIFCSSAATRLVRPCAFKSDQLAVAATRVKSTKSTSVCGAATVALAVAAVLTWVLVVLVARSLPLAGVLLAPYAVWLCVATALSVQYSRLN